MNTRSGSAPPGLAHDAPALQFSALWPALRRGWWLILVALVVCFGIAAAYTAWRAPIYSASSIVYVNTSSKGTSSTMEMAMMGLPERNLANEIEFLKQSVPLAEAVAARIMGADSAAVARRDSAIIKRGVQLLDRGRVAFEPVNQYVDMIEITVQDRDPREAARTANVYAELYRERGQDQSRASVTNARSFLENQVAERRGELADAEAELEAFMTREGAVNLDLTGQQVVSQTASLDAAIDNALVQLQVARASLQAIEREAGQVLPDLAGRVASGTSQQISALQAQIARLEVEASPYYAADPTLRGNESRNSDLAGIRRRIDEMQAQVDALSSRYVQELRSSGGIDPTIGGAGLSRVGELQSEAVTKQIEIQGLQAQLDALRERQVVNEGRIRTLPAQSIQLAQLERTRQATEGMYLSLLTQLQQMRVTEEGELGYVEVIREATVPNKPVSPQPLLNLSLGVIFGIFLGVGLALLRHATDHRLRLPGDVESHGFTLLGAVPAFDRFIKQKFGGRRFVEVDGREVSSLAVAALHPLSPVTEAFRHLRTSVLFSLPDRPIRTLLVTSPEPTEGKSTIALDLAIAFTQAGRRVLYLDADLRKPTGHALLGLPREGGLSDLLFNEGTVNWEAYRHPLRVDWGSFESEAEGFYALTAGQAVPNPTELLGSQKMRELVREAGEHFDLVIVDSAPILAVPEARLLAAGCDALLFVVRANQTSLRALRQARRVLDAGEPEGARFIGVVVNGVERPRRQSGGYGYGGYGYGGYGYGGYGYGISDADFGVFGAAGGDGAAGEPRVNGAAARSAGPEKREGRR
jgi:tyrosine-protein kinase Etk/Wzc